MARLEWRDGAKVRPVGQRRNGTPVSGTLPGSVNIGSDRRDATQRAVALDAIADPQHWTYKVPGVVAASAIVLLLATVALYPQGIKAIMQILATYLLLRFLLIIAFYPVGVWKIRRKEREAACLSGLPTPVVPHLESPVHHIVIIPNYKEPAAVLERTLMRLAGQERARENITVVLAMEEAEAGSHAKGQKLALKYGHLFARVLVTVHPKGLPGEAVGKGSNESWAAREAKKELVDVLGMPLGALTVSSCDADSLFHPYYFAELARQFASDADRYRRFWQAPFRFSNNVWHVPAPVRILALLNNMVQVAELANPLAVNMPLSTYSLSLQLADEVGYWDEAVIAEDWHMLLRSLFGGQGRVRLTAVHLPTTGDAVDGPTFLRGLHNSYQQRVRHAWGAADIGYLLQQWNRHPDVGLWPKLLYLSKLVHDHVVFILGGLLLGLASVVLFLRGGVASVAQPGMALFNLFFQSANVVVGIGTWTIWLTEHLKVRREASGWSPKCLVSDLVTWPFLALTTLFLVVAPTLEAQWRQMVGDTLTYKATPKQLPAADKP